MENTIKIKRVERKKIRQECIKFLKESHALNVYLCEGMAGSYSQFRNFCFLQDNEIVGMLHAKNRSYIHIYLSDRMAGSAIRYAAGFIRENFSEPRVLFGDEKSISRFERGCSAEPLTMKKFIFMEIERAEFRALGVYRAVTPSPEYAALLVPMQVQYEIEEVGASSSEIDRHMVLSVLRKRLGRGEVSAIFEGKVPVAMAGVNARFENVCQIGSVYVVPAYRGKGYGCSVVSYHLKHLFQRYDRIVLFVHKQNAAAYHIYKKMGFNDSGILVQAHY